VGSAIAVLKSVALSVDYKLRFYRCSQRQLAFRYAFSMTLYVTYNA
jgi:hypothetical protein